MITSTPGEPTHSEKPSKPLQDAVNLTHPFPRYPDAICAFAAAHIGRRAVLLPGPTAQLVAASMDLG